MRSPSIPTDAEFVKISSKGLNVKIEQITKRALRNFGEIGLFWMIFYPDFFLSFSEDKCRILDCKIHTKIYNEEPSGETRTDSCNMCEWAK